MADFGKLVVSTPQSIDQEFTLNKPSITLGRSTTNDIVLVNGRISRNHAQIDCTQGAIRLIDLQSANGTQLNGRKILDANVQGGDVITISGYELKYFAPTLETPEDVTMINSESELDLTLNQLTVPISLNNTSQPCIVIHAPDRTWEFLLDGDECTMGRATASHLILDYSKISRLHTRIERKGNDFILRDLRSTNGTWLGGERVDQHILKNGDTFQIGPVKIVFKTGFSKDEMTIADGLDLGQGSHLSPVIFVPGTMGSELWLGSERVWPNVSYLFKHPDIFRYSEDSRLVAKGVLNEMVIVPNLVTIEQYKRMGDYLVEELGYERGNNFYEFAYDWRQDVRKSARELGRFVEGWAVKAPITIIAHSLGTLVTRYYVEKLNGKKHVKRLILMGGPHQGVPKIAANLLSGVDLLPFGLMGKKLTEVIETFPSCYQILPLYPCAIDQDGVAMDFLNDERWVKDAYRPMLRAAREFRSELGMKFNVPTVSIFGYGLKTATQLQLQRDVDGFFQKVFLSSEPTGDTSVPESSAILPGTEIHPVRQYHGTLFVDNDVKMRLKLELFRNR